MENELNHHGIKGQKWGVRRSEAQLARARGSLKRRFEKTKQTKKEAKRTVKDMSDDELRQKINRLRMEDEYNRLSSSDVSKGKSFVEKTIKTAGTVAAVTGTAITIYNNIAKVHNITKNGRNKPLPIVGEKLKKEKNDDDFDYIVR